MKIKAHNKVVFFCFFLAGILGIVYWSLPAWLFNRTRIILAQDLEKKINISSEYLKKTAQSLSIIAKNEATIALCLKNSVHQDTRMKYEDALKKMINRADMISNLSVLTTDGEVLFSQGDKALVGHKITGDSHRKKKLGKYFSQMSMTQSEYITLTKSDKDVDVILMTLLIHEQKKIIGFVFIEYKPDELFASLCTNFTYQKSELFLGKAELDIIRAVPLNKNQADKIALLRPYHEYLLKASNGNCDQRIIQGAELKPMLTAWRYCPVLNVGMALALPYVFVNNYQNICLLFGFLLLLLGLILLCTQFGYILEISKNFICGFPSFLQELGILAGISIFLSAFLISLSFYHYYTLVNNDKSNKKNFEKTRHLGHAMNSKFFMLQDVGNYIAEKFLKQVFSEEELSILVKEQLKKNPDIANITIAFEPYVFDSSRKVFACSWGMKQKKVHQSYLNEVYDYFLDREGFWYSNAIKNKKAWEAPYFDPAVEANILSYARTFYDQNKKLCGVIRVAYKLSSINSFLKKLGFKAKNHAMIIDSKGALIYHPNKNYVATKKRIFDVIKIPVNSVALAAKEHFKIFVPKFNQSYVKSLIPYITSVKGEKQLATRWIFALAFDKSDTIIAPKVSYILFVLSIVFFALFLFFSIAYGLKILFLQDARAFSLFDEILLNRMLDSRHKYRIFKANFFIVIISLSALFLWTIMALKPWYPENTVTVIQNQEELNHYLESLDEQVMSFHAEKLIPIKTGIIINKLSDIQFPIIDVIAQVWQIYDKEQLKTIVPGIVFDKAEKAIVTKVFEKEENGKVIISWKIAAKLYQMVDLKMYPFNKKNFVLSISPLDEKSSIMCVPDFKNYPIESYGACPWINNKRISDDLEQSFFSYNKVDQSINGLKSKKNLDLHIVIRENILNSFIAYLIPLFIALFSIFALLWVDAEHRITAFTGLFFAIILLHRSLRSSLNLTSMVYLEYLFLVIYCTLLTITAMSIFSMLTKRLKIEQIQYYFWPVQVSFMLFLSVLIFFY